MRPPALWHENPCDDDEAANLACASGSGKIKKTTAWATCRSVMPVGSGCPRIAMKVTTHALCHAFAPHLVLNRTDIGQIQMLLRHRCGATTICAHVGERLRAAPGRPREDL